MTLPLLHHCLPLTLPLLLRYHPGFEEALAASLEPERLPDPPSPVVESVHRLLAPLLALLAGPETLVLREVLSPGKPLAGQLSTTSGKTLTLEQAQSFQYLPWGLTPCTRAEAAPLRPAYPWPTHEAVCRVQSRVFSLALEQRLESALPGSALITDLPSLTRACAQHAQPFVLKHPFGVAGRARVFGHPAEGGLSAGALRWCEKVLAHHPLVLEPWVERVQDFGTQFWIPEQGAPLWLGTLELLNEANGTFRGHRLPALAPEQLPTGLIECSLKVCEAARQAGYWGPLGIDSFTFRHAEGIRLRPVVELNARLTMGMVALGLAQQLPPERVGEWRVVLGGGKKKAEQRTRLRAWMRADSQLLRWSPAGLENVPSCTLETEGEGIFIQLYPSSEGV